ncbi:MAG TPA: aldehyde dehydrogenase family protein, partial [Gemmatimonadales bacterium]|nr:aldehyde dehydrogenase family protein [Gemmatimonadales bacterium]
MEYTTIVCARPARGYCYTVAPSTPPDLGPVLARARDAQARWGAIPVRRRARALREMRRLLVARMDEVVDVVRAETGKPRFEALAHDVMNVLNVVRFYERRAPRVLSLRRVSTGVVL